MGDAHAKGTIYSIPTVDNYDIDATAGGLWTDTTHYRVTVAAGHNYLLWGGYYKGNTADTAVITVANSSDNPLFVLLSEANGSTGHYYPDPALMNLQLPLVLKAGDYIEAVAGAAQDGTAYATCVITPILL